MIETMVIALTFLSGFLGIFGINLVLTDLFEQDRRVEAKRQQELQQIRQREDVREKLREAQKAGKLTRQSESLSRLASMAQDDLHEEQRNPLDRVGDWLEQSGIRWTTGSLFRTLLIWSGVFGLLAALVTGNPVTTLIVASLGGLVPFLFVTWHRRKRMQQLLAQLPDALELMSRILRSGQTISQAMQSVSLELPAPLSTEFGYCYEQQNLGLPLQVALKDLCRRTAVLEVKIFVLAILVNRSSGGNLAQLLDNLAKTVRARFTLRGKIRALTAEGRLQAIMLLALPPAVFVLMLIVNNAYASKLFDYPQLIMATISSMAVGTFFIHRIVNFDF